MPDPIKKRRKKHIVNLPRNKFGLNSTVKMASYTGGKNNKRYYAAPTITFKTKKEGKEIEKKLKANKDYKNQSFKEALAAGEVYEFRSRKRAEKFALGSWKKRAKRKEKRLKKKNNG